MYSKIRLYKDTIKYLKTSQIYYRVINRIKRELYKRELMNFKVPSKIKVSHLSSYLIPELDFNENYLNRFNTNNILSNEFTFINMTYKVELSMAWNNKELQHLWRYNLHYFEYLYKLGFEYNSGNQKEKYYEKFKNLITNWINNNPYAKGDGWHPYTISLRITNWISLYEIFKTHITIDQRFDKKMKESIYLQYQYLQKNLEKDVLGNHYFENIKALILCSIFFEATKLKEKFKKELLKQLKEQILEDGFHFELSPMYHKIILEDLIKMAFWLKEEDIYQDLIHYIQKMIDTIYSIESNFGKTPAFNDSADGVSKDYTCLLETCEKYFGLTPIFHSIFDKSGFYIFEDENKKLIFDTGEICPTYLPAHGHCDALSFELSINKEPLIVNSGTYRYESGKWRDYFRSTKSHNTVTISSQEQSQFWGSFRVARRIKKVKRKQFEYKGILWYGGSYVSYLGAKHKRFIGYIDEYRMIVLDYVNTKSMDDIHSYIHFTPETSVDIHNDLILVVKNNKSIKITPIGCSEVRIGQGWYSEEFNSKNKNKFIVMKKDENKNIFGYFIDINASKNTIIDSNDDIKIIQERELLINYDELGVML